MVQSFEHITKIKAHYQACKAKFSELPIFLDVTPEQLLEKLSRSSELQNDSNFDKQKSILLFIFKNDKFFKESDFKRKRIILQRQIEKDLLLMQAQFGAGESKEIADEKKSELQNLEDQQHANVFECIFKYAYDSRELVDPVFLYHKKDLLLMMQTQFGITDKEKSELQKLEDQQEVNVSDYKELCNKLRTVILLTKHYDESAKIKEMELEGLFARLTEVLNKKEHSTFVRKRLEKIEGFEKPSEKIPYCYIVKTKEGFVLDKKVHPFLQKIREFEELRRKQIADDDRLIERTEKRISLLENTCNRMINRVTTAFHAANELFERIQKDYEKLKKDIEELNELNKDHQALIDHIVLEIFSNSENGKELQTNIHSIEGLLAVINETLQKSKEIDRNRKKLEKNCRALVKKYGYSDDMVAPFKPPRDLAREIQEIHRQIQQQKNELQVENEKIKEKTSKLWLRQEMEKEKQAAVDIRGECYLEICQAYANAWEQECRSLLTSPVLEKLSHSATNICAPLFAHPCHSGTMEEGDYAHVRGRIIDLFSKRFSPSSTEAIMKKDFYELILKHDLYIGRGLCKFATARITVRALQNNNTPWQPRIDFVFNLLEKNSSNLKAPRSLKDAGIIASVFKWATHTMVLALGALLSAFQLKSSMFTFFDINDAWLSTNKLYEKLFFTKGERFIADMNTVRNLPTEKLQRMRRSSRSLQIQPDNKPSALSLRAERGERLRKLEEKTPPHSPTAIKRELEQRFESGFSFVSVAPLAANDVPSLSLTPCMGEEKRSQFSSGPNLFNLPPSVPAAPYSSVPPTETDSAISKEGNLGRSRSDLLSPRVI